MSETEVKPKGFIALAEANLADLKFHCNDSGLSPDEMLTGLLDFGLFADKVPPCFTSKGLAAFVAPRYVGKDLMQELEGKKGKENKSHDYIRYQAIRPNNFPRQLGIPHPESYAIQALAIKNHWEEIKNHCAMPSPAISRTHVRRVGGGCIFEMNYKGKERYQFEEDEIEWRSVAKFVVKADIARCFPSMYTHSIPWAIHGKDKAKEKSKGKCKLYGDLLDKVTQGTRDKQTNGLLIGPHASNVISEIILTRIDKELQDKGHKRLTRHIDDYTYYAETHEDAEKFLVNLGLQLRSYELELNEKKTEILKLPSPSSANWTQELQRFSFPKSEELRFSIIRSFLDLALECARADGTLKPLKYAIKMLEDRKLNERARRLYVQEAINLGISYPYLVPVLDKLVFDRFQHTGMDKKITEFAAALIRLGYRKLYPDMIAHALYFALKHNFVIPVETSVLTTAVSLDDCLVNVLLLEYAQKNGNEALEQKVNLYANKFKGNGDERKRGQDRNWLLIYQAWTEEDLRGNGQSLLADLKKGKFQFLVIPTSAPESLNALTEA